MPTAVAAKKKVRINGCVAAAQAAKYADVDVITAYPIRPYTATMMALAQMVANGELDAEYIVADSEHSQLSIAHGASSSGARVFTGSSGVGVQFAYELYSPISGSRMPVQMMIADRTLDPPGDFGSEHTDALSTRDMGWLMGWSCDAQEAFDNHLLGVSRSARIHACCCRRWSARTGSSSRTSRATWSCRPGSGEGVPAAVQASVSARSATSGVARTADHAGAGPAASARARPRDGRRHASHRAGARRVRADLRPSIRSVDRRVHDRRRRRRVLHAGRPRGHRRSRDPAHARSAAPRWAWCGCGRSGRIRRIA